MEELWFAIIIQQQQINNSQIAGGTLTARAPGAISVQNGAAVCLWADSALPCSGGHCCLQCEEFFQPCI